MTQDKESQKNVKKKTDTSEMDDKLSTMKVFVTRSRKDPGGDEFFVKDIRDPKWGNISGGYGEGQAGYSLYGYIDYCAVAESGVSCSGTHENFNYDAKVMIPYSLNREPPYKDGYEYLKSKAKNEKPKVSYRKAGLMPCNQRIMKAISEAKDKKMARKDLRTMLVKEGYTEQNIRNALHRIKSAKDKKLAFNGYTSKQIISLL